MARIPRLCNGCGAAPGEYCGQLPGSVTYEHCDVRRGIPRGKPNNAMNLSSLGRKIADAIRETRKADDDDDN